MHIRFCPLRSHLLFFHSIWLCNVQTTCLNAYVTCCAKALRSTGIAWHGYVNSVKTEKWKILDFVGCQILSCNNYAYAFLSIVGTYFIFLTKIYFRHNLYVMRNIVALCNIFMWQLGFKMLYSCETWKFKDGATLASF